MSSAMLSQENEALAREFSSSQRRSSGVNAAAATAALDPAQDAVVKQVAEDHRTRVSRFMPTSRRIVQVGSLLLQDDRSVPAECG